MDRLTNVQVKEFLTDFAKYSETYILEEGKEKNEIEQIAKAKGIQLKNNRDLAGFKTIYTFADKANKNRARLPKTKLLKALPGMIGKPVDIDHDRKYVVGHYIDYRYIAKDDMVVAYGVFYKSNFGKEWEEAKKLFKEKKLSTSYEIWCPKDKRKFLDDGTYELLEQEIAGGALLFSEEPAFEDAKVLEFAKVTLDKQPEDLVFANKYNNEDLITSKEQTEIDKAQAEEQPKKLETVVEPIKVEEKPKIRCSNCGEEITASQSDNIKCAKCFAILDKNGSMIYPPQIMDFRMICPSCKSGNWLILSKKETDANIKCLTCSKEYSIKFQVEKEKGLLDKVDFVYSKAVRCPQCATTVYFSGVSRISSGNITCKKCGLSFPFDIHHETYKSIASLEPIDTLHKSSEQGGEITMEFMIENAKYHRYVDDYDKLEATLPGDYGESTEVAKTLTTETRNALPDSDFAVVVRVKNKKTGKMRKIRMFPINDEAHVRNALARIEQDAPKATLQRLGVSVEKVKAKIQAKARKFKIQVENASFNCTCVDCGHAITTEEHCANLKCPKCGGQMRRAERPGNGKPEEKSSKVTDIPKESSEELKEQPKVEGTPETGKEPKAEETPKTEDAPKAEEPKQASEVVEAKVKTKEELYKEGIKKLATQVIELQKKVKLYEANAQEIIKRKEELGEFASAMKDEDILNDDKFARAKAEKENTELRAQLESGSEQVGTKRKERSEEWYKDRRKKIDDKAFGHLNKQKK